MPTRICTSEESLVPYDARITETCIVSKIAYRRLAAVH